MRILKKLFKVLIYLIVVAACLEIALLILGYRAYTNVDYKITSVPEDPFIGDEKKGFQLNPGVYEMTLNEGHHFKATHLNDGTRLTVGKSDSAKANIHLLGCSITYGYGVNDEQTFASVLQKKFPDYNIINHGVMGYGSVQSCMQLKELKAENDGDMVFLMFSKQHLIRNTLSQEFRSHLKIGFENSSKDLNNKMGDAAFPCVSECGGEISFVKWNELYENYPGREWLASINFIQTTIDQASDNKERQVEVSACVINDMLDKCLDKRFIFGIACIDDNENTDHVKSKVKCNNWLDIGFDFENNNLTNYPYDTHPNAEGHKVIADKLAQFIIELEK
ncbi:hypothetical protein K6119_18800 [Paracrocinitomix mangrovi]|uniref:hypothetical protein n=1 Tax=Paracrocinitomix mangrovi TaxID=2862509 RepID=UPI001C8EFA98|nr:hypothetical protein [Paracrocinitomix mangrovi]UKN01776.1 hypothetical protein K6119_18800 [Paracrocinitomix mangrovi]